MTFSLITVSTSGFTELRNGKVPKKGGEKIALHELKEGGHKVISTKLVDDEKSMIRLESLKSLFEEGADVVILMGGTGISKRDLTVEALKPLFDKELEGFSELFRMKSYEEIGTAAYLSRALAGVMNGKIVFCLPGSPSSVETALRMILPEINHALYIANG